MKNLKKILASLTLAGIIMMGVTSANAGLLLSDFAGGSNEPCSETKSDTAVIMSEATAIIVSGFTAIIVSGLSNDDCVRVDNGILLGD